MPNEMPMYSCTHNQMCRLSTHNEHHCGDGGGGVSVSSKVCNPFEIATHKLQAYIQNENVSITEAVIQPSVESVTRIIISC